MCVYIGRFVFIKAKPPICSTAIDPAGTKKFMCRVCSIRLNKKNDVFEHLRSMHGIRQPTMNDIIVMLPDEAARTLLAYERLISSQNQSIQFR